ncbi:MAG: PRK06851 family protein [Candidatus Pristimantibacillus sp.]
MTGIIKNFYGNGNTAQGFASLFDSSLQNLERLFILKGGSIAARTDVIRAIADEKTGEDYDVWLLHCPSDNKALDGLIIPALKLGVIDGAGLRFVEPVLPQTDLQEISLDEDSDSAQPNIIAIERLNTQIAQAYDNAYAGFAEALRIHDEWETPYIANMDFQAADQLAETYIYTLFGNHKLEKSSRVDRRFLGAATPQGSVDFVPNLTEGLNRYFLKGRAGSGKSTFLKKLAATATERGFDVEIYHCGFDSNSLDMVIVRELDFAIFDSTAPHEYFPDRDTDIIIDMYTSCITPGTDEAFADEIAEIKGRYSARIKQSIGQLAWAKTLQDEREQLYAQSTDSRQVEQIREEIIQAISGISSSAH